MECKRITKALVEEKKCIVCQKNFFRRAEARVRGVNMDNVRKAKTLTCSRECSRVYIRVCAKVSDRYKGRISLAEVGKVIDVWLDDYCSHGKDNCLDCIKELKQKLNIK